MDRQHTHTNPLYSSMLTDAGPKDLVHVLVRRLTRIREVRAARDAVNEPIAISDASISEILVMLQKQMQSNDNRLRQRNETEEFLNCLDSACIGAMSATDYEGVQEAVQVIQDEIRKVRQRGK